MPKQADVWIAQVPCASGSSSAGRIRCWYDGRRAPAGLVQACSDGRHRYRSTGQRWVREPAPVTEEAGTLN